MINDKQKRLLNKLGFISQGKGRMKEIRSPDLLERLYEREEGMTAAK
jgi:hypothetical protein